MPSLFHTVPNEMLGTVLYPLNELARVDRAAWERERAKYEIDASQWRSFEPDAVPALAGFNEASRRYYRECAEAGTRPLLWGYLRHVFHRGALDVRELRIVEV